MIVRLFLILGCLASVAQARPNVVLFLVDDLGWRDLGVTGSDFYQTPRVDALFESGVHFRRGYASCQVCSPTRASLMTGKAPPRHGITMYIGATAGEGWKRNTPLLSGDYARQLPAEDTTLAEAMKAAGYATFFAGKWHLGGEGSLPTDHGFEINVGGNRAGAPSGYFSPYKRRFLEDGPPGEHLTLRLANETADFVKQEHDQPFFAMLSFYTVHSPIQSTRERWAENRLEALAKPTPENRFVFDRYLPVRQVQDHPVYAGMVESMDDAVGTVLDAIAEAGLTDDTIVVFTSDNGGVSCGDGRSTSCLPLRGGKGRSFEGGHRVPLAIAWPGQIDGGQVVEAPAITTDIYPTLLDLCGLPLDPEQHIDGLSLASSMRGEPAPERPLYWHYPHYSNQGAEPSSMIVDGDWKLIRYHEDGREELYNLVADVGEQNDVADANGPIVGRLGERLDAWLEETGAVFPVKNPNFDAQERSRKLRRIRTQGLQREEEFAARILEEGWAPNETWWGSAPKDDEAKHD